jgi:hypothetical protein
MASPPQRPRLVVGGGAEQRSGVVRAHDLAGLDWARLPQELAAFVPGREAPWPRGTCLPPVDTPAGRQALCFGTAAELEPESSAWRKAVPVNGARTLWVVTYR